jgi:hypothetical protein
MDGFFCVQMPCNVVSDLSENLTVLWKKENIDLGQVGFPETERISQDQNYSLHIKNLTFADSGGSPPPPYGSFFVPYL